jgi:PAS domain S-box-containing protein
MQNSYQRLSVTLGFSLLMILLIVNAVITRRQLGVQVGNQFWVVHTQQTLLELSQTESLVTDAETGQRGFLYTGDSKYLAPYDQAVAEIKGHIDRLAELTADNPRQQARISELRGLVDAKLGELGQTISYYRAGKPEDAKAIVLSDRGRLLMTQIRGVTAEMVREEDSLWTARSATYQKSVRVTVACIYLASGLAAIGLALLAYFILNAIGLRERHARQLAEREEWFRSTLTSLGDAVIATDEQGRVTFLNTVAEQLIGVKVEQAKGRAIGEVFRIFNESTLLPVENPVKKVMEVGRIVGLANHTVLQKSDGVMVPIEDSAAPIRDDRERLVGVVLVFRDATYERKSQELLRKSEKLAAAARLSATVAHEINNPLEAVGNLVFLARGTADVPAAAADYLLLAEQELERISHITRQTLGFYRESKVPNEIDVAALVDSVLKIYSNKLRTKNIKLERHFSKCPVIHGLAGELKQVVANLVSNAADAAPENGTIRVGLSCVETSEGKMVEVSVQDDGPGINPEHREMIFEPFFTTKKDVGTGLGLWVSKEIVDRHGGRIQALSLKGDGLSGALFNVHLPLAADVRIAAQES